MIPATEIAKKLSHTASVQQAVFSFIVMFYEENSFGPSLKEVREALAVLKGKDVDDISKNLVYYHLKELCKRDKIELILGRNRQTATRIRVKRGIWVFRGHTNIYLTKSEHWKE